MRSIAVRPPGKLSFLDFRCGFNIWRWTGSLICNARTFFETAVAIVAGYDQENR